MGVLAWLPVMCPPRIHPRTLETGPLPGARVGGGISASLPRCQVCLPACVPSRSPSWGEVALAGWDLPLAFLLV